jgi:ADP-heptose:LPS heptosyltransferase
MIEIRERGNPALHFADRYIGIPTVALLGGIKRKQSLPSKIQSIGLLKLGAIGDTVLMSAVISDLRAAFPHASVIFFSGRSNFEIARMLDGIDRVVQVPIANLAAGLRAIRSVAVDALLDFGQWSRVDALLSIFSQAAFTLGFSTPGQHRDYGYDLAVEHSADVHELENFRRLVRVLGVETRNGPFLRATQGGRPFAEDYAAFHLWPGGRRSELKQWPSERWLLLMEQFAKWGIKVVLTGAPTDRCRNDQLIASAPSRARCFVKNAAGLSLQRTAATLAHSRLVVSVNTGVMHIAAALDAPLVALHGPTSSKRWGPISDKAVVVDAPEHGCGYLNLGWERPARPLACMQSIRYEAVRDACRTLLAKRKDSLGRSITSKTYAHVSTEGNA